MIKNIFENEKVARCHLGHNLNALAIKLGTYLCLKIGLITHG
jgi:hypothetical protein